MGICLCCSRQDGRVGKARKDLALDFFHFPKLGFRGGVKGVGIAADPLTVDRIPELAQGPALLPGAAPASCGQSPRAYVANIAAILGPDAGVYVHAAPQR